MGVPIPGDGEATVSWQRPLGDNGEEIVAYVVTPYIGDSAQVPVRFESAATSQLVTGLTNGVGYRFAVYGINGSGHDTASSALSDEVTPARPFFASQGFPLGPAGLVTVSADGVVGPVFAAGDFRNLDLAPDRSWLVAKDWGVAGRPLVTVNTDGTGLQTIATGSWQSARISPDGTQIAAIELPEALGLWLWIMDRDGTNRQRIHLPNGQTNQVDWSPDGSKLLVTNTSWNLLAVYDLTTLTQQVIRPGPGVAYSPQWSPDGSLIAFTDGNDLVTIPATGGPERSLTPTFAEHPAEFTWDGANALLFRAGNTLYRTRLDGSPPQPVAMYLASPAS
jgi:hypothetical protein